MSSLPASIKKIWSKTTEKRWRHRFSHCNSMGAFCCHGNQSFDLICPKTLCSLSPTPVMLHIKFDVGWPAGFRDIQVWKCGRRRRRQTDDGPLLYYKLTLFCLCWGLTSQSTIFQSCRDGATASWVINQYFRGVKCLAQGHNTAAVGFKTPDLSLWSPTLYHWATALPWSSPCEPSAQVS